jgi:aldehyde dehydrogenase (NAD+)
MNVAEIFETMAYGPAPESDDVAQAWLDDHGRDFGLFINGEWVRAEERATYTNIDPVDDGPLATSPTHG